jgi:DNA polymerase bacteriophage-type
MTKISLDFETYSECDIRSAGAWIYAKDKSTRVLCMGYAIEDEAPQLWLPNQPLPDFIKNPNNYEIHAWNSFFEWVIWTHVLKQPTPPITQWHDTAGLSSAMALPRALGMCGTVLGLPDDQLKSKRGYYLIQKLSIPNVMNGDKALLKEMYDYCLQDVVTERAIAKKLYKLNDTERKVWVLDQKINIRGIKVDRPKLKDAIYVYENVQDKLKTELIKLTDLDNPNSQKQFLGWLLDKGLLVDNVQKATLKSVLDSPDKFGTHDAIKLKLSLAKTAPKKYMSMKEKLGSGTRLHGNIMYHGASTGRWASTGVNLQNIARPTLDADKSIELIGKRDLTVFEKENIDPMEALSSGIRGMLIPTQGKKFIVGDYASIEARALAWLAGQEDKLEIFRGDGKIYEHASSKIYKKPIADITKNERFIGKISELACGYGGGAKAFKLMAKNYGVDIPHKEAEIIKQQWRKANQKIVKFWYDCDKAVSGCIGDGKVHTVGKIQYGVSNNFLMCKLPSGRRLYYYRPKVSYKKVLCYKIPESGNSPELTFIYHPSEYPSLEVFKANAIREGVETFEFNAIDVSFWGTDSKTRKWCQQTTYGGKLVENITQAVARDIMAESMLLLEQEGFEIVLTVHDEIISEVENGTVEKFKEIMERPPTWGKEIPIAVEAYEATRYRK